MTHNELRKIAGRRGWVQWTVSKTIERLEVRSGQIYVIRGTWNNVPPHRIRKRLTYDCVEIKRSDWIKVEDLLRRVLRLA